MRRTSRREMRTLLELAGKRPVPPREEGEATDAAAITRTGPSEVDGNGNGNGSRPVTTDDLRALLTLAGSRPVPAPDPVFLAETEARILGDTRDDTDERRSIAVVPLDELAERRARRVPRPVLLTGAAAAAIVAVLVVVGAVAGVFGGDGGRSTRDLALVTAVDTVVVLPDGTRVVGAPGVELPDGTIIRTGPHGHATIADVELGPDTEAVVRNGRVRVLGDDAGTQLPAGGGTGTEVVPPPAAPGAPGAAPGGGTSGSGSTSGGSSSGSETPTSTPPTPPPLLPPIVVPNLPLPSLPPPDGLL